MATRTVAANPRMTGETAPPLATRREDGRLTVALAGDWRIGAAGMCASALAALAPGEARAVELDLRGLSALDTAGAWLIHRAAARLREAGCRVRIAGATPDHAALIDLVGRNDRPRAPRAARPGPITAIVERTGAATIEIVRIAARMIAFLGLVTITALRVLRHPRRMRWIALVSHMERAGLDALPIVGLISLLIGLVLAYQGAEQLQRFGAQVFVVDLVGISVLREIGILLTAIVVAGRSGSAFTASIGSMKVREEIDAMRTLGLDPIEALVLPRVIALVLTLPLLAFLADMLGLAGGGLMVWAGLDITPDQYIERLGRAIPIWSFWVGMIKAPIFAFLIAMVGCFEGFAVAGSAESVGRHTTKAVVEAIFLVIVVDAALSVLFSYLGI